jgi:hypothetical protein
VGEVMGDGSGRSEGFAGIGQQLLVLKSALTAYIRRDLRGGGVEPGGQR